MRTKLFAAFFAVILLALLSNLIFERLILNDFEEYVMSAEEDQVYRVLAAIEGHYGNTDPGKWDVTELEHSLHWALILGFEAKVLNLNGNVVMSTQKSLRHLSESELRRIASLVTTDEPMGTYTSYPLFMLGEQIGALLIRPLKRPGLLSEKETVFHRRGKNFLLISFLIAGGGALFLAVILSLFLTVPIKRLKHAAEAVASGDLDVKLHSVGRDEIGRLMRSFNHMVEALRRDEQLRKHLTSNIAHELRTPLAVMRVNLEAVADGVLENPEEGIRSAQAEVARLVNLVEGIEDFTKAEASFFKPTANETFELRELLGAIAQGMGPLFASKGLSLELKRKEPLPVTSDPEKLEIIVRNIVTNALNHTQHGGCSIDYGMDDNGMFLVAVSDTGPGVTVEEMDKIFKRFYKGSASEGVGLGLSIATELATVMHGEISVTSTPGKGATFTVSLPAEPQA